MTARTAATCRGAARRCTGCAGTASACPRCTGACCPCGSRARAGAGTRVSDTGSCSSAGATAGRRTHAIVTREQSNGRTAAGTLCCDAQNVGVVGGQVGGRRYPASVGCTSNRPSIGTPVRRPSEQSHGRLGTTGILQDLVCRMHLAEPTGPPNALVMGKAGSHCLSTR